MSAPVLPIPIDFLRTCLAVSAASRTGLVWTQQRGRSVVGGDAGSLRRGNGRGASYWRVRAGGEVYTAHRVIWAITYGEIPDGLVVDHIDTNALNNAISNLRLATNCGNACNRSVTRALGASRFKGVARWHKARRDGLPWRANVGGGGAQRYLGSFATEREAAHAYNVAALEALGEYARINDLDAPGETIPAASLTDEQRARLGLPAQERSA